MDEVFKFINNINRNLNTVLTDVIGGLLLALLLKLISVIVKRLSPKPLQEPKEQAVYLNMPKRAIDDNCIGRDKLLKTVRKKITDGKKLLFIRKSIVITGEEGIGKTSFCYRLFKYDLQKYPIYLGWIECNGKQSVFDIIRNTFDDSRFYNKSEDNILNTFSSMRKPCVLFVDQVDQHTPLDELEKISHCSNVILVLSGLLRNIYFADCAFILPSLSTSIIREIFEKNAKEKIECMCSESSDCVNQLLQDYVNGNPFLAIAFANVKHCYGNEWKNVLKSMQTREYEDNDYLKNILRQLYRTNQLSIMQKSALLKLSTIQYTGFTKNVFEILDISDDCVRSLCDLYWLEQKDGILYFMDKTHCNVVNKSFMFEFNLENAIDSINVYISEKMTTNNDFRWVSLYIEDILKRVQRFAMPIMKESFFSEFAYNVARKYFSLKNFKKCLEWAELCKPMDAELAYKKSRVEFQAKYNLVNKLYSPSEVEQAYSVALEKAKNTNKFENNKNFLLQEYCNFLIISKQYNEALLLCKKYFETNSMDLRNVHNCRMFHRYLFAANKLDDKEALKQLVNEKTIQALYQNEKVSITAAWSFGLLGNIFKKMDDKESSDMYMRHMVVLVNERQGFFDKEIKTYLDFSEEEFAEYMHSCDELLDSLNDALDRKDPEAFYIEGRYQEKYGNYQKAFILYESAAAKDSLRGMCSLALLYYRGQGKPRDYEKARRYWEYCCARGHRGSYYWLGILLLDTEYKGYDKESALRYLKKAAELGSEHAKQKLLEV